ncbi:hypothetical protein BZB76_4654 [Actinomadura pelletieri DSM 43383]|uniref:Uncharacterized protein n=1 Tax=Actinomadura pelletieri DSM 43383 TaxID=1120940 RepID=A0A495QIM8_9ACTN|nr:hypothetical protein [Actinomadura pelletieri]RKS71844.1 hypothetical protein BZB76_4654 [Actinomadura pelletieri DSM 43383]
MADLSSDGPDRLTEARAGLGEWAREGRDAALSMAEELGVPARDVEEDPLVLLGPWDGFLSSLPLGEFDDDDRSWLRTQIAAFIALVLLSEHGGRWDVVAADDGPRYVVTVTGGDGRERHVDPLEVAREGLRRDEPVVLHMLGDAEALAGVAYRDDV